MNTYYYCFECDSVLTMEDLNCIELLESKL